MKVFIIQEKQVSIFYRLIAWGKDPLTRGSKHLNSWVSTENFTACDSISWLPKPRGTRKFRDLYSIQRWQFRDATLANICEEYTKSLVHILSKKMKLHQSEPKYNETLPSITTEGLAN